MTQALLLSRDQVEQLAQICATYRAYAWQRLAPTPERNQIHLTVSAEEQLALRHSAVQLLHKYVADGPSEERTQAIGNLVRMRVFLERSSRLEQPLGGQR